MLEGGKRIVNVDDPGRGAKELTTLEMAVRLPGRDIVVPTTDDWEALQTYVLASNPGQPESDEFLVKNSTRVFRITMNEATTGRGGADATEIPRARPVGR